MQILDITAQLSEISFQPENELEEILQNVRTILTTAKFSVPLDRNFGLDTTILDMPINIVQAKLSAEIIAAVHRYEPRAGVKKIIYQADIEGVLKPTVRVAIK